MRLRQIEVFHAIYTTGSQLDMKGQNKVVADAAAILAARFGG